MAPFSLHLLPPRPLLPTLAASHKMRMHIANLQLATCYGNTDTGTDTGASTVDCLVGRLAVWPVGWLVGWFVGCSVGNWAVNFNYCQADDYTLHSADRRS